MGLALRFPLVILRGFILRAPARDSEFADEFTGEIDDALIRLAG